MSAFWELEIPIIVRSLIGDLDANPTYSDDRILQLITVAAQYVLSEANIPTNYTIDVVNYEITPDPTATQTRDVNFIGLVALKAACLLDLSTFRTKAVMEGIRTSLGSANLSISGNLAGYKSILDQGPCALYQQLLMQWNIGNATAVQAILSPFVGNDFDPRMYNTGRPQGFFPDNGIYS